MLLVMIVAIVSQAVAEGLWTVRRSWKHGDSGAQTERAQHFRSRDGGKYDRLTPGVLESHQRAVQEQSRN